jgi:hypothetical protein
MDVSGKYVLVASQDVDLVESFSVDEVRASTAVWCYSLLSVVVSINMI